MTAPRALAWVALVLSLVAVSGAPGSAASFMLAWDASADPKVVGYTVWVGTASGQYTQAFDVGTSTTFDFPNPAPGTRYYFAVAGYTSSGVTSPLSNETSAALAGTGAPAPSPPVATQPPGSAAGSTCLAAGDCYAIAVVASGLVDPHSVAVTEDGRAFFIEGFHRVRVVANQALLASPALTVDSTSIRLTGLALGPSFRTRRQLFVAGAELQRNGLADLVVTRYRDVQNRFGEAAAVIRGITVAPTARAPIAIDSAGHVHVAVPRSPLGGSDPYGRTVLRFNADGTVPQSQPAGSPIFATGYASPTALAVEPETDRVWMAGADAAFQSPLAHVAGGSVQPAAWPQVASRLGLDMADVAALAVPMPAWPSGIETLYVATSDDAVGPLARITVRTDGTVTIHRVPLSGYSEVVALGSNRAGTLLYVAAADDDGVYSLLELRRGG